MHRRLAAIRAADVASYCRLISKSEEATVYALQTLHAAVLPVIESHGGRIVDTAGDQVLAEFGSALGAVQSAIAIQELVASRNTGGSSSPRLELRIGVTQGDIVASGVHYEVWARKLSHSWGCDR